MLEQIKLFIVNKVIPFLTVYVSRWTLKFVGSVLTFVGWEQSKYEEFIGGIILFIFGILWTLVVDKKRGK